MLESIDLQQIFFFNYEILNTLILNLSDINVLGWHGLDSVTSCQEILHVWESQGQPALGQTAMGRAEPSRDSGGTCGVRAGWRAIICICSWRECREHVRETSEQTLMKERYSRDRSAPAGHGGPGWGSVWLRIKKFPQLRENLFDCWTDVEYYRSLAHNFEPLAFVLYLQDQYNIVSLINFKNAHQAF